MIQSSEKMFPNNKLLPYNEYRILTSKEELLKELELISTQSGWHSCYFYSVCRARVESESTEKNGLFMRRFLNGTYRVAFVPKEGDPLGGVVYSCYGPHPLGGESLYSFCDGHSGREEYASFPSLFRRVSVGDFQAKH